ncbi:hypothetical protein SLA2020_396790 [Shorea laevis]
MAETFLTPMVDVTISKLISAIADQINLAVSWKAELRRLKDTLTMIRGLLQRVGERQVTDPDVKLWLERLRDAASDADDVLDEVAYENLKRKIEIQNHIRRKVCYYFSLSNPLIFQMKMAKKIKNIIATVDDINKQAQGFRLQPIPVGLGVDHRRGNPQTTSFCDVSQVVGRDDDVSRIVELLIDTANQLPLRVISIIGMGGLGKTTLAQSVRNKLKKEGIKNDFAKIVWVCVSENFDVERILKEMLESVTGSGCGNITNVDTVIQNIQNELVGENYLLILDDVWNLERQKWEELRRILLGIGNNSRSRIVVTTRDERVASTMGTLPEHKYHLKELEKDARLFIIKQRAFGNSSIPSDLEPIGREIAEKCGGVPLVANVIGATLCNSRNIDDWLSIKNKMKAPELQKEDGGILSILKLSFDRLPDPALKQCFAFCSIFPKDYVMQRKILIELWMAEGFIQSPEGSSKSMEDIGDEYFNDLLSYSLFQVVDRDVILGHLSCKMHDLIHDLAQSVSKHNTVILESISERNIPNNVQHLNLIYGGEMVPTILGDVAHNLHTLFSKHDFFSGMQTDLKRLRVLNLCGAVIEELPFYFDNMKSLRFLGISSTNIKELPKSFSKLYNLQTFRFMFCEYLKMPSEGVGYLINLRHIYFIGEGHMPANVGRLTSLQTLGSMMGSFFVGTRKGLKIEELGSLSRLKGSLVITNLELVKDKSEAKLAKLHEKAVDELRLCWGCNRSELELEGSHDEDVLEGLRPHSNLQRLKIDSYGGKNLPSWILSANELFSPNNYNLVQLDIRHCRKLNSIPVINGHSSLKQLTIWDCSGLTSIANGAFEKMSLEKISIRRCPKLESLGATCLPLGLKELYIGGLSGEAEESLDFSFIHHIHASLEKLSLFEWKNLTQLPHQIQHLTALRELKIESFIELDALPEWLGNLSSLVSLAIEDCKNLKRLPSAEAIRCLAKLKELRIRACPGLMESCDEETGAEWPKISHIPNINLC